MIPAVGKSGAGTMLDQLVDRELGVVEQREAASMISVRLCGGMLVAMPTAMPDEPLIEQVGQPRRQHRRLLLLAVVVRHEIDGFLVDVGEQLVGDLFQTAFGVAHTRPALSPSTEPKLPWPSMSG